MQVRGLGAGAGRGRSRRGKESRRGGPAVEKETSGTRRCERARS
jgi:hypothetical protein